MESELIEHIRRRIGPHRLLKLGPGDDAAVLRMANVHDCVMTVDVLTDQVDFELSKIDLTGDMSAQRINCESCGAELESEHISVKAGAIFVSCPYCGSDYQMVEEPKW